MIPKRQKLNRKDINFLIKRQNIVFGKNFSFFYFNQYSNKKFNQISFQTTIKLSKKAVVRNDIKRILYNFIKAQNIIEQNFNGKHYKIFVIISKKNIEILQKVLESKNKKSIMIKINELFENDFNKLIYKI
jgi:RNase P protein component